MYVYIIVYVYCYIYIRIMFFCHVPITSMVVSQVCQARRRRGPRGASLGLWRWENPWNINYFLSGE
jgi:hypothetical protein